VSAMQAGSGLYGPEQYVVQFQYNNAGQMVRRVVRDNTVSDATRFEETFEFDGRGQTVREKIMAWDAANERMVVKQDIVTSYDLGGNPTEIKFYDNLGLAYTETRTYARGYQLTGASFTTLGAGVTVTTSGTYGYDTNNNIVITKKVDAKRGGTQLAYRAQWTFTYDRKNRLKTHTYVGAQDKGQSLVRRAGPGLAEVERHEWYFCRDPHSQRLRRVAADPGAHGRGGKSGGRLGLYV